MNIEQAHALQIGQNVIVSDGRPRPPEHHTRKLASWKTRNYAGIVEGLELDGVLGPRIRVEKPTKIAGVMKFVSVEPIAHVHASAQTQAA